MEKIKEIISWLTTENRPRVFIQSISLAFLCIVMFNAGRTMEQDNYVKVLDRPYPLHPQPYFGGLNVKHLKHTW